MNQTDLAEAIGVSLRTIQLYEKKDANIPIKNLTKIADVFGVSIAELYLNEVNEEEGVYSKKKVFSASGNIGYSLANGKYLVMAPVLMEDMQEAYLEDFADEQVKSPGQLRRHYAPPVPLILDQPNAGRGQALPVFHARPRQRGSSSPPR